jgi:hypothetical protein
MAERIQLVRYSEENRNDEALKGKYGALGEDWGYVTAVKNLLFVNAFAGATVGNYSLPEVYDGFLICSDGSTVPVTDSTLNLALAPAVTAQGVLKLRRDN